MTSPSRIDNTIRTFETDSIRLYRLPRNEFEHVHTLGTALVVGHRDDFVC